MVSIRIVRALPLLMCVLIGAGSSSQPEAVQTGRVIDSKTRAGVEVAVTAWTGSRVTGFDGVCPQYGEVIDSTKSTPDGRFSLKVKTDKKIYTVTYCANGFFPRADPNMPVERLTVTPPLVELFHREQLDDERFRRDISDKIVATMNYLAYVRSAKGEEWRKLVDSIEDPQLRRFVIMLERELDSRR